jgi:predicted cupin superfamily sugar epimerase
VIEAKEWIERLRLQPHPEGGFFREAYRSGETISRQHLPPRFSGDRAFSTAIYFLLEGHDFSALHRIRQDEVWHFYDGCALTVNSIAPDGELCVVRLGRNVRVGDVLQAVVPAGWLFGARPSDPHSYSLLGCTVAPGFDFADFELPTRHELLERYPQHAAVIEQMTRIGDRD